MGITDEVDLSAISKNTQLESPKVGLSPRALYAKSISTISASTSVIPANEFLANLDSRLCVTALEFVLTLLASQSLLALKDANLSGREKQLIRRELFTELSIYHDFVKKKILFESKEILCRKKFGCEQMRLHTDNDDDDENYDDGDEPYYVNRSTQSQATVGSDTHRSMRVHVVRKLHLQQKQHKSPTSSTSGRISPRKSILNVSGRKSIGGSDGCVMTSTPTAGSPASSSLKRVNFEETPVICKRSFDDSVHVPVSDIENDGDCIEYYEDTTKSIYSSQSFVKLVEEDYFHILSVIFSTLSNFDD